MRGTLKQRRNTYQVGCREYTNGQTTEKRFAGEGNNGISFRGRRRGGETFSSSSSSSSSNLGNPQPSTKKKQTSLLFVVVFSSQTRCWWTS